MSDPLLFVHHLARVVDLLRNDPGSIGDWQRTIGPLADLAGEQSAAIRLADGQLMVEDTVVPPEMAFVPDLVDRMTAHQIGAIHIAFNASPPELLQLGQALALDGAASDWLDDLVDVRVVDTETERAAAARRAPVVAPGPPRLTPLRGSPLVPSASPPVPPPLAPVLELKLIQRASKANARPAEGGPLLERLLQKLRKPPARNPFEALERTVTGIREAVETGREQEGAEIMAALIREEKALPEGDLRRQYGITMQVLFSRSTMRALGSLLLDPLYQQDAMEIMARAGGVATEHLLGLLIDAPTFAQRRALLEALRNLRQGNDQIVGLLNHHEWYVVRNVADLAGELGVEAAIDRLGAAIEHPDPRVRKSAGVALARIAAPAAGKYLRKALRDPDREVRSEVARTIGKGLAGLGSAVTAVLETEPDPDVKLELYRALGRIGTPDMVQFLRKAAESGGLLVGRKPTSIRVAAVQGLALAGSDAARDALRTLSEDGEKTVRAEAKKALARAG